MIRPGDLLRIPGKNPERTGNTPQLFEVLTVSYALEVRYADGPCQGRETSFAIPAERAESYKVSE